MAFIPVNLFAGCHRLIIRTGMDRIGEGAMDAHEEIAHLYDLHANDVYRFARLTLDDPTDAEDVVQEVFIRALRKWDQFRFTSSPKTWLLSITRNCVTDVLRRKRSARRILQQIKLIGDEAPSVIDVRIEIEDSLRYLTSQQRQVFILRIIEDLSIRDTALILGLREGTVKTLLHRAVSRLRKEFAQSESVQIQRGDHHE